VVKKMRSEGIAPDVISFSTVIKAAVAAGDLSRAEAVVAEMRAEGVEPDVIVLNTILAGYAAQLRWDRAVELLADFEEAGVSADTLSFSLLLRSCVRAQVPEQAKAALTMMRAAELTPNTRIYSMLLSAYAQAGWLQESLDLLQQMQNEQTRANKYCYSALMEACIVSGQPETAHPLFEQMQAEGIPADTVTYTLLIRSFVAQAPDPRSFGKRVAGDDADGERAAAVESLEELLERSFTTIEEMIELGGSCEPNVITYNALLQGCINLGSPPLILRALRGMLTRGIAANRNTFRLLAMELPHVEQTHDAERVASQPREERKAATAASSLDYYMQVVEIFDEFGRQLNGDVYLALLRACATARDTHAMLHMRGKRCAQQDAVRGQRATFVLRQAQLPEAIELEDALAQRHPAEQHAGSPQ